LVFSKITHTPAEKGGWESSAHRQFLIQVPEWNGGKRKRSVREISTGPGRRFANYSHQSFAEIAKEAINQDRKTSVRSVPAGEPGQ